MPGYKIISADTHVFEPADLWTTRVDHQFKDRAPHVVREADGDWWYCDNHRVIGMAPGTQTGMRFETPDLLKRTTTIDRVRPGGYIAAEHVKDMDGDGVDVNIIFPTVGLLLYSVPDSDLVTVMFRTYNDWLAEWCRAYPDRLKGVAALNVDDVPSAVKELERCAKMGLVGGLITVYPPEGRGYDKPEYEPLWSAAEEMRIPLGLHVATNRPGMGQEFGVGEKRDRVSYAFVSNTDHWVRMSLGHMVFSGVFERHPRLQVGSVEHELAWIPHFLERFDYTYTQRFRDSRYRFKESMLPSQYLHRNTFYCFQQDALGIRLRDIIGVDNLLWGSDYPHVESTFPRTQQILGEILAECKEEEKAKIVGGNAARIFHLN